MSVGESTRTAFRWSRLVALVPVAITLAMGAIFFWSLQNNDDRLPSALLDEPIPEFNLGAGDNCPADHPSPTPAR